MGDRTTVTLSVLESQKKEAQEYFEFEANDAWLDEPFAYYQFEEVNYGTLGFLDKLKAAGIAYESQWDRGSDYGAGIKSVRFTADGEVIQKEIYDSERDINPALLMEVIDEPEKLRQLIISHNEEVSTLSWENQEQYGKIYRAKQLITPT